jgi:hypothetical protein
MKEKWKDGRKRGRGGVRKGSCLPERFLQRAKPCRPLIGMKKGTKVGRKRGRKEGGKEERNGTGK